MAATNRLVVIQFSFSNPNAIPQVVKRSERETPVERRERQERNGRSTGVMVVEPTENCSIVEFLGELKATGYEMVDAFYKERIDPKDPRGKRTYHMVRFIFVRHDFVEELSDEFRGVRDEIAVALMEMCRLAMWRIRVFSNPFYKDGLEIPDQRALSINLEARKPLFSTDGQPVMVWPTENGRRVGNAPLPLKPGHSLHFVNNTVNLTM